MLKHRSRFIPELNTTSTADISFMLLIFFLVTTSMDADKGLQRRLPPAERQQQEESVVDKTRLLTVKITADNKIEADGQPSTAQDVAKRLGALIDRQGARHLITLDADPKADYATYFELLNSITDVYAAWRNRVAVKVYGRPFAKLSASRQEDIRNRCPQRMAEQYRGKEVARP